MKNYVQLAKTLLVIAAKEKSWKRNQSDAFQINGNSLYGVSAPLFF